MVGLLPRVLLLPLVKREARKDKLEKLIPSDLTPYLVLDRTTDLACRDAINVHDGR